MKTRRPARVCQTRERVGDEGTSSVASTGHARGTDHHELVAMSEGLAEEASGIVAIADRRVPTLPAVLAVEEQVV